jgi:hypothetical protein
MGEERFRFTNDLLDRAISIKERGDLTWAVVANILGCSENSLQVTLCDRKKGRRKGRDEKWVSGEDKLENWVAEGKRPVEIARVMRIAKSTISERLLGMGLDTEERLNLQAESNPRIGEIIAKLKHYGASQAERKRTRFSHSPRILELVTELRSIHTITLREISRHLQCNYNGFTNALYYKNRKREK